MYRDIVTVNISVNNEADYDIINVMPFNTLLEMHISLQKITNNLSTSLVNISTSLANNNNLSMSINNLSEVLKNSSHITASISTQPPTTTLPSILLPSSSPLPSTTTTTTTSSSSSSSTSTTSSTSTSSTSSTSTTSFPSTMYFTSSNVVLSKEINNWLIPYKSFRSACFACSYFGHGYKECPNIKKTPNDLCLNC
ncbi:hypothetical protein GLOIN_2v1883110 [Rhizophagus clarus]|uniref:CCHC-type domain-containing protein n=1 Tax=Rhizophagus clarus TaxID=94130 RepID=A0A8H3QT53_9GLOM|nr:hypothetical protein GLOIN_2v1883110 [Rhizophagus clarus]